MFNDLTGIDVEDHELKKRLECELPKLQKVSARYRRCWRIQVGSLTVFLLSVVLSVIQSWWYLLLACVSLGGSLYANGKRMDLSREYSAKKKNSTGKDKAEA